MAKTYWTRTLAPLWARIVPLTRFPSSSGIPHSKELVELFWSRWSEICESCKACSKWSKYSVSFKCTLTCRKRQNCTHHAALPTCHTENTWKDKERQMWRLDCRENERRWNAAWKHWWRQAGAVFLAVTSQPKQRFCRQSCRRSSRLFAIYSTSQTIHCSVSLNATAQWR